MKLLFEKKSAARNKFWFKDLESGYVQNDVLTRSAKFTIYDLFCQTCNSWKFSVALNRCLRFELMHQQLACVVVNTPLVPMDENIRTPCCISAAYASHKIRK